MKLPVGLILLALLALLLASPVIAAESVEEGTIFTLWPLVDYRSSPREKFSNLSILGPLFKYQQSRNETLLVVRPLLYQDNDLAHSSTKSDYLYPLFSSETGPDMERVQALRGLFEVNSCRHGEQGEEQENAMLFPFFIKGNSPKYGPYWWVFPFYGNAYERFWKDEYHFVMFPLYGRTVNKGTTTRHYLYPFFSTTEGEQESGFQVWPLYGQARKEGVYRKQFLLWPFFFHEQLGLNTDHSVRQITVLPFYTATDGPQITSRHVLWPFFGFSENRKTGLRETDWFWPFWVTASGNGMEVERFLPFYADERSPGKSKQWYLWPFYRHDRIETEIFEQDRRRILYFLFNDVQEKWPTAGADRRQTMVWPLFAYRRDERGVNSVSFPAPVEPILDREGIEKSWAPLWRLYLQRWNDAGDSAVSLLWNLYWHEVRGNDLAYELFPLVFYQGGAAVTDLKLLKGLIRYRRDAQGAHLSFFWLPFSFSWGGGTAERTDGGGQ